MIRIVETLFICYIYRKIPDKKNSKCCRQLESHMYVEEKKSNAPQPENTNTQICMIRGIYEIGIL